MECRSAAMARQRIGSAGVCETSAPQVPSKPVCCHGVQPAVSPVRWTTSPYAWDGVPLSTARNGAVPVSLQTA